MPNRVVDDLESVKVNKAQRMLGTLQLRAVNGSKEACLEFPPIDEPRERIVTRLMRDLLGKLTGFGNVLKDKNRANNVPPTIPDRRRRVLYRELTPNAAHKQGMAAKTNDFPETQTSAHRIGNGFPRLFINDVEYNLQGMTDGYPVKCRAATARHTVINQGRTDHDHPYATAVL